MGGSQQNNGRRNKGHQAREWLSRTRDDLASNVLANLMVLAIPVVIGLVLGAGLQAAILIFVAVAAFSAGRLATRRRHQPPENVAGLEVDDVSDESPNLGAEDVAKLTSYFGLVTPALSRLEMGRLDNVEAELLIRPARLLEQWNRGSVQLAVFEPGEGKDGEACWHLRYVAGISRSECREFEVPLKASHLAQRLVRWEPRDGVFVASDLREDRWRKAGADFEAFAEAGFRMLRCLPFGAPSSEGKRSCLVLLSKESKATGTFGGADDFLLKFLGTLLSMHSVLNGGASSVSEEGRAD